MESVIVLFKKKVIESGSESLSQLTWRRFKKNRLAVFGLVIIIIASVISILGYLITPDQTPYANDQKPELHIMSPGSDVKMLLVKRNQEIKKSGFFEHMLFGKAESDASFALFNYRFSGADILVEEFTGNTPNKGSISAFNIVISVLNSVSFALLAGKVFSIGAVELL